MFILNQTNDDCIEIHRIKMCKHYNDDVTKKINNIRSKYRNNAYNYGSTENAMRRADKEIDDFLYNIKNVYNYTIEVNDGICVATYDNLKRAEYIYNEIISRKMHGMCDKGTVISISNIEKFS